MKKRLGFLLAAALMLTACASSKPAQTTGPVSTTAAVAVEVDASCPFLTILNEFTETDGLHIKVSNESNLEIDHVRVYTLWYDQEGNPVDIGGSDVPNATKDALAEIDAASAAIFIIPTEEGTAQVKQVVAAVYFTDGTVWENENIDAWLAANLMSY